MSTSNSELVKEEEEESANEVEICELAKPRKCPKQSHKKREPSKYDSMKVYPTSNRASRERLKRMITVRSLKLSFYYPLFVKNYPLSFIILNVHFL